jgi:hypothetical protein
MSCQHFALCPSPRMPRSRFFLTGCRTRRNPTAAAVLAQSSNVPFVQFRNVPCWSTGGMMPEEMIALTKRALHRLKVVEAVTARRLTQAEAGRQRGLTTWQVKRRVAAYRAQGAAGRVSRRIGEPSNRRLKEPLREAIRALRVDRYPDFGPTLAQEKLAERHPIEVSVETVRQLQVEWELWRPKRRKAARAFQLRERRGRCGELIQIDGSPHDWFEARGPRCRCSWHSPPARPPRFICGYCDGTWNSTGDRRRATPTAIASSASPRWNPPTAPPPPRSDAPWQGWKSKPSTPTPRRPRGAWNVPTRPSRRVKWTPCPGQFSPEFKLSCRLFVAAVWRCPSLRWPPPTGGARLS